jgi:predicted NBD/HSP70 family sugar kinase
MTALTQMTVGANAERARSHNRQVVLGRVRSAGRIGRAEIARASGLSTQAVSNIIAELLADGLIVEQGRLTAGRGLPAVQYGINPSGGFGVGIEIRPDAVLAGLLDLSGETVAADRRPLAATDRETVTKTLTRLVADLRKTCSVPEDRLLGAGIVMPGPFGETGIQGSGSELPLWDGTPPAAWFSERLGLPVTVENDANAAAMAERISGVAQGLESYAFLYFGSGLGLGVVHKGQLMAGAFGNAGEIGHIPVPGPDGPVALETAVSRLSVHGALGKVGIQVSSADDLAELYSRQDPTLLTWLDAASAPLAAAVTIIENLFDPETIILGGAMPDSLLDHLIDHLTPAERSVSNRAGRVTPRLQRGGTGRMTATLGAAALVINQAMTPQIAVQG